MGKFIVLVNREAGSGGREIAEKMGAMLGVKVYTKAAIQGLVNHFGISEEEIENIRSRRQNWWDEVCSFYQQFAAASYPMEVNREITPMQLYHAEARLLKEIAAEESCIIVGRAGFHIFKDAPNATKIFLIAKREDRIARIASRLNVDDKEAARIIDEVDKEREAFTKTFAKVSRYDARSYDVVCNVSGFDQEAVAESLVNVIRSRCSR